MLNSKEHIILNCIWYLSQQQYIYKDLAIKAKG